MIQDVCVDRGGVTACGLLALSRHFITDSKQGTAS